MTPTVLVTGASGFIGARVAAELVRRGVQVRALSRNMGTAADRDRARADMETHAGADGAAPGGTLEPLALDLSTADAPARLVKALNGVSAVIHAAANLAADEAGHARDTLDPTRALVAAMLAAKTPPLLVLVSSFSVYNHAALPRGAALTEETPLESCPAGRDAYARAKLAQEDIAREAAAAGLALRILRPAMVYGPGRLNCAHLGVRKGPLELALGSGPIMAVSVFACAEALALAALAPPPATPEVLNVVEADSPDRARWRQSMSGAERPALSIPAPTRMIGGLGAALTALGLGGKLPTLLRPPAFAARFHGAPADPARLHAALGWSARRSFEEASQA